MKVASLFWNSGFIWVMGNLESCAICQFIISISRPGKSWNLIEGHGKIMEKQYMYAFRSEIEK